MRAMAVDTHPFGYRVKLRMEPDVASLAECGVITNHAREIVDSVPSFHLDRLDALPKS
jgi:hypothetical protein